MSFFVDDVTLSICLRPYLKWLSLFLFLIEVLREKNSTLLPLLTF